MKKLNTTFNGSLNYLAGISSPTAANLTVQGLTEANPVQSVPAPKQTKRDHNFNVPFSYVAGVSSPTAANIAVQGLTDSEQHKYFKPAKQSTSFFDKVASVLGNPNPTTMGYDGTDPRSYLKYRY